MAEQAEEAKDAETQEPEYPLSMRRVLFSYKGRITRREYWLKGFVPVWLFAILFSVLVSGTAYYTSGTWLFRAHFNASVRPGDLGPVLSFKKEGRKIIGKLNGLDTGATHASADIVLDQTTKLLVRNYLVGTQHLRVTTVSRPTPKDPFFYNVQLQWPQYPLHLPQQPATPLVKGLTILLTVFYVLLLWPYSALWIKRLHDRDKKGWWALLFIIPLLNMILLIVLGCIKGTDSENRYGPDPQDAS